VAADAMGVRTLTGNCLQVILDAMKKCSGCKAMYYCSRKVPPLPPPSLLLLLLLFLKCINFSVRRSTGRSTN
jgi:hypothetical protein